MEKVSLTVPTVVRVTTRSSDFLLNTQKVLLAEIVGPPQGVTGASNVASVFTEF